MSMKLAYLAANRSALKAFDVIQKYYSTVDFYLAEPNMANPELEADNLPLLLGHVLVPARHELRTSKHESVLKKNQKNYQALFDIIYPPKVMEETQIEVKQGSVHQEFDISDINFIKYNKDRSTYSIENSKTEIIEYDFVLIQNTQLIMASIVDRQQNLFHSFTEQSKVVLTLQFELKQLHKAPQENSNFIFIENGLVDSIQDNWYFIQMNSSMLEISFFIPMEMQSSEEYLQFLKERTLVMINRRFVSFKAGTCVGSYIVPTDGFYSYTAKLRNSKGGALVPAFSFWTKNKMQGHINQVLKNSVYTKRKSGPEINGDKNI